MARWPEMNFTFEAVPFFDDEDEQWKPSVKILVDGQFFSWTVFELGFDEPRFAEPYARTIMREMIEQYQRVADDIREDLRTRGLYNP